jgi:hypothetical protein
MHLSITRTDGFGYIYPDSKPSVLVIIRYIYPDSKPSVLVIIGYIYPDSKSPFDSYLYKQSTQLSFLTNH